MHGDEWPTLSDGRRTNETTDITMQTPKMSSTTQWLVSSHRPTSTPARAVERLAAAVRLASSLAMGPAEHSRVFWATATARGQQCARGSWRQKVTAPNEATTM